jgi:hypothetical protein
MDLASLTKYAMFGDGDMCAVKDRDDKIQRYVKLEDVVELLKRADNSESTPLCEQAYYACAIDGKTCQSRADGSKCVR